jgi:hypothetical protein
MSPARTEVLIALTFITKIKNLCPKNVKILDYMS